MRPSPINLLAVLFFCSQAIRAEEPPPRTTLSDPAISYTVPHKPYVVLRRGEIEAVIVDNRAVDDDVLPGHRSGYSGLASLKHTQQSRNLFVPKYAGLNLEHVIDGSVQDRAIQFEPRHVPMELRVVNEYTAELHQSATPFYGVESCQRFELLHDGTIEMTVECIPRRKSWKHDYLLLFWASYIDQPESLDIHYRGVSPESNASVIWIRGITPEHGRFATHRALDDNRDLVHMEPFPLPLVFGFSRHRYSDPWYYGVCRGMAFAQVFRSQDQIRLTQSPSGGGSGCPAWDFQWAIPNCELDRRYQMVMRAVYSPWPGDPADEGLRESLRQHSRNIMESFAAQSTTDNQNHQHDDREDGT